METVYKDSSPKLEGLARYGGQFQQNMDAVRLMSESVLIKSPPSTTILAENGLEKPQGCRRLNLAGVQAVDLTSDRISM